MPISGDNRWAVQMKVKDGKLIRDSSKASYKPKENMVEDPDKAIKLLLAGEVVWVHNYVPTYDAVVKAVEAKLKEDAA